MTKEEILKKHVGRIAFERPDDTFQNVMNAMQDFADQSVNDYKEKLKIALIRNWYKKTGDEIYDLIDSL